MRASGGTAGPRAPCHIWFNSVLKASGPGSSPCTINVKGPAIQFTANGTPYTINVPDAQITLSPSATTATTTATGGTWVTTVPSKLGGNLFLGGVPFLAPPGNFPGGVSPVTWTAVAVPSAPGAAGV